MRVDSEQVPVRPEARAAVASLREHGVNGASQGFAFSNMQPLGFDLKPTRLIDTWVVMQLCDGVEVPELEPRSNYAQICRAAIAALRRDTDYSGVVVPPLEGHTARLWTPPRGAGPWGGRPVSEATRRVRSAVRVCRVLSWLSGNVSFKKRYEVRGVTGMGTRDELRDAALHYTPRSMNTDDWAQVRDFTQSVTLEHVIPTEPDRASLRLIMLAVAQAAHVRLNQVGGELTYTDVFDPLVVEYVVSQTGLTDRAKGVRRSLLYRLGHELNPNWPFDDRTTKYGYKAPDAPYTEQEQHFLAQWARGLSNRLPTRGCHAHARFGARCRASRR